MQITEETRAKVRSLNACQMLLTRGSYRLGDWRQAREQLVEQCNQHPDLNDAIASGDNELSGFKRDWYDEVLGVLCFTDWTRVSDGEALEIAPKYEPLWDFRLCQRQIQITLAIPDARLMRAAQSALDERQFNAGVQRARRDARLRRDGWVDSHALVAPNLEYIDEPDMVDREDGIRACRMAVSTALGAKADKLRNNRETADTLIVYGPDLSWSFGPKADPALLLSMMRPTPLDVRLSAYGEIYVVSSQSDWVAAWNAKLTEWTAVA